MPWNGSGTFNRIFSWVADKAAGLDISSSRMDTDTNDIASSGFGNCLTRDGQGQPSANLPMAGFRHTGVQNAVNRTDYAAFGQVQDGLYDWTVAGGTADALTATYTPALTGLSDGQLCFVRASGANSSILPTFSPNGLTARPITKLGGSALAPGDIPGNLSEIILRYGLATLRWELLNPASLPVVPGSVVTASIANKAVTYAKQQDVSASRLIGNATGGAAAHAEIALGTGLSFSGGNTLNASIGPALVPNYLSGLTLSTAGGSGTMSIAAGVANDSTNTTLMSLAAIAKTTASWVVGNNNGGLDTGSIANATWYHFYEIERPDTGVTDVIFSLSAASPALPANYTLFRRIGAGKTDASAHWLAFTQIGDQFIWSASVHDSGSYGTSRTSQALAGIPTGLVVNALFQAAMNGSGGQNGIIITALIQADVAATNTGQPGDLLQAVAAGAGTGNFARFTDTSARIGVRASTATIACDFYVYGWIDLRGK